MRMFWLVALAFAALPALAAEPAITGRWKTVDDKTGKPKGIVLIYEQNGEFFGKIESSIDPKDANKICDLCKDERKNKPVTGMVVMRHMKRDGDEYGGGDILDPDNGKVYRCKAKLAEGGKKLIVRGYIGISLLGRSQTWTREP
ncbi:MAG TPA: DUF2147 domain-containing protein [Bryobacteraceae bacterium]|jgi:uncharacterized protein (DUF2147 family)